MKPEQIEDCAQQLVEFHGRFAPLFYEKRQAHWGAKLLHGLLLDGVRKNAAKIARAVPEAKVKALQHFISQSSWDNRPFIEQLQVVVSENLADPEAILVPDDTGFAKKGDNTNRISSF